LFKLGDLSSISATWFGVRLYCGRVCSLLTYLVDTLMELLVF